MGAWVDLPTAVSDLRVFLNDGPSDRPVKRKKVIGNVDGSNTEFFIFEERLIPAAQSVLPGGVQIVVSFDDQELPAAQVTVVDSLMGEFITANPPSPSQVVRARYYYQFFLDSELQEAISMAGDEILEIPDIKTTPTNITLLPQGMRIAALNYAGYFAYQKQAMRWAQQMSMKYLLQEEPIQQEVLTRANMFRDIAKDLRAAGDQFRANFYKRHGRREAPAFGWFKPNIPYVGPRT